MKTYFGPVGRVAVLAMMMTVLVASAWAQYRELYPGVTVDPSGTVRINGKIAPNTSERDIKRSMRGDMDAFIRAITGQEATDLNDFTSDDSDVDAKIEADKTRPKATPLPGITMTEARTTDLMSKSRECIKYQWAPTGKNICCKWCKNRHGVYCCLFGDRFDIKYWEPSALIEVSCRNGYSMMSPGKVKGRGDPSLQACVGFNKPGNSRWFFEARVWAINGYDGGLRHQGAGAVNGERMRQCTMENTPGDLPWPGYKSNVPNGYGKKWDDFTRGAQNGPSGSWEAYISDNDPTWAQDGGGSSVPNQKACKIGSSDLENCWGPMSENGWVSHPNPKVAAALVAWRAHEKAVKAKKVSPPGKGGGYKMAMEYPWNTYAGDHAESMGVPGGGKKGSGCFQPGDSGPAWFGGKSPEEIPDLVAGLNQGNVTTVSEINPGVYIFTVWVYTSCTRYKVLYPTHLCHYEGHS